MKTLYQKSKTYLLIIVTLIGIFWGCKKAENAVAPPPPVITVTASVAGSITDLNNTPVSGASVSAGSSVTTTDANGMFIIKNIQLDKDAGFVTITKPGFFTGSRTFLVNSNTVNNVKIQLIPKTVSGNFDAASGGNINVSGGGSVNFGANNIVNESNNTAYTGSVSVSTFYLNPSDANFNDYMPGALRGLNSSDQQKILQSFGMVSVEMDDASGGKLQIASGKTAAITIPIPTTMQVNAPATIPLSYFDETKGVWKQEGSATKQGTNYVGTVAHFSFWTAGQLVQDVRLDATFKDQNGKLLANNLVTITSTNYGTSEGYTDSAGTVSGLIPANETLVMKALDQCNNIISMQNIGPFSADTNLGNISVTVTAFNCIADNQFISLTLNGVDYSWTSTDSLYGARVNSGNGQFYTKILGATHWNITPLKIIDFNFGNGTVAIGNYSINVSISINTIIASYVTSGNTATTNVTEYGIVGGYISGTASGQINELNSTTNIPFTMAYRVKRIQ
jgi:hypothetical protein